MRLRLIKSLSTDDFDQAYHAWINVEIGTEQVLGDLRLERDTFMRELSAAGALENSRSVFYDIAHDVEVWRLQPECFQAREALRDCKTWVEEQRAGVQRLHEALQAVERPNPWVSSEADLECFRVMSDLQEYIGKAAMEHALGTLAALDQRLEGYLQGWDSRYPVEPGRPPNKATQDLLHRLSETYECAGGRLTATWTAGKNCPQSPFAKFLVLIYAALPSHLRYIAADTPRAFVESMARRVLSDRKKGRGPSGVVWMEPVTDEAYQALLAHRALLERGFSHDG